MKPLVPIAGARVCAVFKSYPPEIRKRAMRLRRLVLDTAAELAEVVEGANRLIRRKAAILQFDDKWRFLRRICV